MDFVSAMQRDLNDNVGGTAEANEEQSSLLRHGRSLERAISDQAAAEERRDVFVVETIGQNGQTWLDMRGLPCTETLRVIERYTRPTIGRIYIDVTIQDPEAYTRPWSVRLSWDLQPDTDLIESICEENSKDLPHMVGK